MTKSLLATLAVVLLSACATTQGTDSAAKSDEAQAPKSSGQNCQEIMVTGSRLPQKVCSSAERKSGQAE